MGRGTERRRGFLPDERGGSYIEYLVVVGLVAIAAQLGWRKFGGAVTTVSHAQGDKVAQIEGQEFGCVGTLCVNPGSNNGNTGP
jgi:Flp pilus assembly pilin Flp